MSYLEELLPEFRKGAKIRKEDWSNGSYIYLREGTIYGKDNTPVDYAMDSSWLSCPFWEFYQEPEPDWQYIIDNKCLCYFWDDCEKYAEEYGFLGFLTYVQPSNNTDRFEDLEGKIWKYCRPVHRDEVTFYEDIEK